MAVFEVNGALVAGTATVTFAPRYDAVVVENDDATNGIYVRTDGVTPASPWNDCYYVAPSGAETIPNDDAEWFQGQGTVSYAPGYAPGYTPNYWVDVPSTGWHRYLPCRKVGIPDIVGCSYRPVWSGSR
jgi:hypothetical protein